MKLTDDQRDLLKLLAIGSTRYYASVLMDTSPSTVARTLSPLYARTGATTTIELLCFLIVTGTLQLTPEDFPDCALPELDADVDPYAGIASSDG